MCCLFRDRAVCWLAALLMSGGVCAAGPIAGLGVVGDSISDEYEEQWLYDHAENWAEQLVFYRGVNMGPTAAAAGVGDWGEPRRTGFEHNWARWGDDTAEAIASGQHTGLGGAVQSGAATHAVVFIGNNDFSPWDGPYTEIYDGDWTQQQIDNHIAGLVARWEVILDEVNTGGADMLVCTIVDFSVAPAVWSWTGHDDPVKQDRVAAAIALANAELRELTRQRRGVVLDMNALLAAAFGPSGARRHYLPIGGVDIDLWDAEGLFFSDPQAGFVSDGNHPNTVIQGVMGSAVLAALDAGFDTGVTPFSEAEILANAGLSYGGADTLVAIIGEYTDYITDYTCPGDINGDGLLNLADVTAFIDAFVAGDPLADINGDGLLNLSDVTAFIAVFQSGC